MNEEELNHFLILMCINKITQLFYMIFKFIHTRINNNQ